MNANRAVTAVFAKGGAWTLVILPPEGMGTFETVPGYWACQAGERRMLRATPAPGSVFMGLVNRDISLFLCHTLLYQYICSQSASGLVVGAADGVGALRTMAGGGMVVAAVVAEKLGGAAKAQPPLPQPG